MTDARTLLATRLARGEIDNQAFDAILTRLSGDEPTQARAFAESRLASGEIDLALFDTIISRLEQIDPAAQDNLPDNIIPFPKQPNQLPQPDKQLVAAFLAWLNGEMTPQNEAVFDRHNDDADAGIPALATAIKQRAETNSANQISAALARVKARETASAQQGERTPAGQTANHEAARRAGFRSTAWHMGAPLIAALIALVLMFAFSHAFTTNPGFRQPIIEFIAIISPSPGAATMVFYTALCVGAWLVVALAMDYLQSSAASHVRAALNLAPQPQRALQLHQAKEAEVWADRPRTRVQYIIKPDLAGADAEQVSKVHYTINYHVLGPLIIVMLVWWGLYALGAVFSA